MVLGQRLGESAAPVENVFAEVESILRPRAERVVAQAAQNDGRQLKELGAVGQWVRDRLFPLFAPLVARELGKQYDGITTKFARAA